MTTSASAAARRSFIDIALAECRATDKSQNCDDRSAQRTQSGPGEVHSPVTSLRSELVVTGLCRYVRNPIYIAVVAVIFGQALLFGDWRLLWYGALLWFFFHIFVVMYEEPTLKQTFGPEYEAFRANVPRWIPRLTPRRVAQRNRCKRLDAGC